jgi:hypothetical protein
VQHCKPFVTPGGIVGEGVQIFMGGMSMSTTAMPVRCTTQTPTALTTTLYDLIAALQDVAGPDEGTVVVAAVMHLMRSRRLTWHRDRLERHHPGQDRSCDNRSRRQATRCIEG